MIRIAWGTFLNGLLQLLHGDPAFNGHWPGLVEVSSGDGDHSPFGHLTQFLVADGDKGSLPGIAEHLPVQEVPDPCQHNPLLPIW